MLEPRDKIEYAYETANIRFTLFRSIILVMVWILIIAFVFAFFFL